MNDRKYLVLIIFFVIVSESDSGKTFTLWDIGELWIFKWLMIKMEGFFGGEVDYIKASQFESVEKIIWGLRCWKQIMERSSTFTWFLKNYEKKELP